MLSTLRRSRALRALANTLLALTLCIGSDAVQPANARSPRRVKSATAVAPAGYLACRDMPAEVAVMSDCWSGPDESPKPSDGMSLVQCLTRFDYDGDGDVDLADHAAYLTAPAIELGFAYNVPYACLSDGDTLSVSLGFQGGIHLYVTIRGTGFPPCAAVGVTRSGVMVDDGSIAVSLYTVNNVLSVRMCDGTSNCCVVDDDCAEGVSCLAIADGLGQVLNLFTRLFMDPGSADGRLADLTFTVTDHSDPPNTATVTTRVLLIEDY